MQQRRRGRGSGRGGLGSGGYCVCPKCKERIPHKRGVSCQEEVCPKCGAKMLREGSYHYELWKKEGSDKGLPS